MALDFSDKIKNKNDGDGIDYSVLDFDSPSEEPVEEGEETTVEPEDRDQMQIDFSGLDFGAVEKHVKKEPIESKGAEQLLDPLKSFMAGSYGLFGGIAIGLGKYTDPNAFIYDSVIKEYGSMEKALEAGSPEAIALDAMKYDGDNWLTDVGAYYKELESSMSPEVDMDILGKIQQGDWLGANRAILNAGFRNLPQRVVQGVVLAGTGNPWLASATTGVSVAGSKIYDINQQEELTGVKLSEKEKLFVGGLHGAIELTASRYLSTPVLNRMIGANGAQATKAFMERTMTDHIRNYATAFGYDFSDEALTSLGQDATDYLFNLNPDMTMGEWGRNAFNSGIVGGVMGLFTQGGADIRTAININTETKGGQLVDRGFAKEAGAGETPEDVEVEQEVEKETPITEEALMKQKKTQYEEALNTFTGDVIKSLGYDQSRTEEIKPILDIVHQLSYESDIGEYNVIALMAVESDIKDTGNDKSSAKGPLQVTETALAELDRLGIKRNHNFDTVEGKVEAGIKYLEVLKNHYGFKGDDLLGAYFAGPTAMRRAGGLSDLVIEGQISTREYVQRFHENFAKLKGLEYDPETDSVKLEDAPKQEGAYQSDFESTDELVNVLNKIGYDTEKGETYDISRRDTADADLDPDKRPQGLYVSIVNDVENHQNPFPEAGDTEYRGKINTKNPLEIEMGIEIEHERFGKRGAGAVDAGVGALKTLVDPEIFEEMRVMNFKQLKEKISKDYPDYDYTGAVDSYDLLSAYGALVARDEGYDAIINRDPDSFGEDLSEIAVLNKEILSFDGEGKKQIPQDVLESVALFLYDEAGWPMDIQITNDERTELSERVKKRLNFELDKIYQKEHNPNYRQYTALTDNQTVVKALELIGYEVGVTDSDNFDTKTLKAVEEFVINNDLNAETGMTFDPEHGLTITNNLQDRIVEVLKNTPNDQAQALHKKIINQTEYDVINHVENEQVKHWDKLPFWDQMDKIAKQRKVDGVSEAVRLENNYKTLKDTNDALTKFMFENRGRVSEENFEFLAFDNRPTDERTIINTTKYLRDPKILKMLSIFSDGQIENDPEFTRRSTHAELKAIADRFFQSNTVDDIVEQLGIVREASGALKQAMKSANATVFLLRNIILSGQQELISLQEKINSNPVDASDVDLLRFVNLEAMISELTGEFGHINRSAGRILVADNIYLKDGIVNLQDLSPEHFAKNPELAGDISQMVDRHGGRDKLLQRIRQYADDELTPAEISRMTRDPEHSSYWKALIEYRSGNLFRHIGTQLRNISGQLSNMTSHWVTDFASAGLNIFRKNSDLKGASLERINRDHLTTFRDAIRRVGHDLGGIYDSMFNPIVTSKEIAQLIGMEDATTLEVWMQIKENPALFEDIINQTQMGSKIQSESLRAKGISADNLIPNITDDTKLGEIVIKSLDNIGALLRLSSFGVLEASDRPFSYAGYTGELGVQLSMLGDSLGDMTKSERVEYLNEVQEVAKAMRKVKMADKALRTKAVDVMMNKDISYQEAYDQVVDGFTGGVISQASDTVKAQAQYIDQKAKENSEGMTWKDSFDGEGMLEKAVKATEDWVNRIPPFKFLNPVVHTPLKMALKTEAWMNPVGYEFRYRINGERGRQAQTEAVAQLATSWGLMAGAFSLASAGLLTPPARNSDERERMQEAGVPQSSIYINGRFINYNRLGPIGNWMTIASVAHRELMEISESVNSKDEEWDAMEVVSGLLFGTINAMTDQTMVTGFQQTLRAMNGRGTEAYLTNLLNSMDVMYTARSNYTNYEMYGVNPLYEPYYTTREGVIRRDKYGEYITRYDSVMGMESIKPTDSKIRQEVYMLDLNLPELPNTIQGVELTKEEYDEALSYLRDNIKIEEEMNKIVESPSYKTADVDTRRKIITTNWKANIQKAEASLIQNPEFLKRIKERLKEKREQRLSNGYYNRGFFNPDQPVGYEEVKIGQLLKDLGVMP